MNQKIKLFLKNKEAIDIYISLSVFFLIFTALYFNKDIINVFIISHNSILTAIDWLNGKFFWPGPEIPYEKHYLPGPLMYFLLMPPLLISKTPYSSSIIWLIIWLSMTFTVAFSFVKTICKDHLSPLLFLILIFTSPFLFHELLAYSYWNNIYSLFFHMLVLFCLYNWQDQKKDFYLCLLGIVMGLGVQTHYSILFHSVTLAVLLITDERLQSSIGLFDNINSKSEHKPFQWKYLSAFSIFFLFPQIPYLMALSNEAVDMPKPDYHRTVWLIENFFANPLRGLKNLLNFMDFQWLRMTGILSVCIAIYIYKSLEKEKIYISESLITLFLIFICPVLTGFVFSESLFFVGLFVLILFVKWHDSLWPKKGFIKYTFFAIYCLFLSLRAYVDKPLLINQFFSTHFMIFAFLCLIFSIIYIYKNKQKNPLMPSKVFVLTIALIFVSYSSVQSEYKGQTYRLKEIMRSIYRKTEWTADTAINRVFAVGFKPKRSFTFFYHLAMEEEKQNKNNDFLQKNKHTNHGYFIISKKLFNKLSFPFSHEKPPKSPLLAESFKPNWSYLSPYIGGQEVRGSEGLTQKIESLLLSENALPSEVQQEILNKNLKIYPDEYKQDKYILASYTIGKKSIFPEGFHNAPTIHKEPDWFKEACYFSGLFQKDNFFYFCYLLDDYFETIAISMEFSKKEDQNFVIADITGPTLTVVSSKRVIHHHFIKKLKLELLCDKKEKFDLLSSIGLNTLKFNFHKSFFAPIKIKKPIKCRFKKMKKISIYIEHKRKWDEPKKLYYSLEL